MARLQEESEETMTVETFDVECTDKGRREDGQDPLLDRS